MKKLFVVLFVAAFTTLSSVAFAVVVVGDPVTVPEPISTILFLAGGTVLAVRRLRKKK